MQLVKDVKTKNRKLLCFCIYLMFQINCTFKSLSVTIQNPTWRHSGNKETAVSIKNNPMTNFKCAESNLITELKEVCRKIIFPWKDIMYKVPCCGSSLPLPPQKIKWPKEDARVSPRLKKNAAFGGLIKGLLKVRLHDFQEVLCGHWRSLI